MRNRILQFGTALIASMAVTFCSTSAVYAATGRAGVNAALADCLKESRLAVNDASTKGQNSKIHIKTAKQDKESKQDTEKKKEKTDTICGLNVMEEQDVHYSSI